MVAKKTYLIILFLCKILTIDSDCFLDDFNDFEIETDFNEASCTADEYYKEKKDDCGPGCVKRKILNEDCPDGICPPGLFCNVSGARPKCAIDPVSCLKYVYIDYPIKYPTGIPNTPQCTNDGKWQARQCRGGVGGRCFCSDEDGNRIFGFAWAKDKDEMHCQCSRARNKLIKSWSEDNWYVSLHCDSMGNYEPLQCDVVKKLCWCADTITGKLKSKVVPQKMMKRLPCYNETVVGNTYLRQCESLDYAQSYAKLLFNRHGTTYVEFAHLLCDGDGSYGPKQFYTGVVYCKWKDNTNIKNYLGDSTMGIGQVNCNCARDVKYFEVEGRPFIQTCEANGNYKIKQQGASGDYYCVDINGFRTSTNFTEEVGKDINCTNYLQYDTILNSKKFTNNSPKESTLDASY